MTKYGMPDSEWEQAKKEIRRILVEVGRAGNVIAYSELVAKVRTVQFQAHDLRLDNMLYDIPTEEDEAGRGLLSVIVVHKSGDQKPGKGFFEMAKSRGRDVQDED